MCTASDTHLTHKTNAKETQMSNTKSIKPRQKLYDDVLVIRLPQQIKEQFELIATKQLRRPSEVAREVIMAYVNQYQPMLHSLGQVQTKPKQRPAHEYDLRLPTSSRPPSQQGSEDWDDWA